MNGFPLSAEEAKIWTYKNRMRYQKGINNAIERAVMSGKTHLDNFYLDEFAIDGLRGLGYKIDVLDETPKYMYRREQYLCKVSWIF